MADDLNTAGAISRLHELAREIAANSLRDCFYEKALFLSSARFMGLLTSELGEWSKLKLIASVPHQDFMGWSPLQVHNTSAFTHIRDIGSELQFLILVRRHARLVDRNYALADKIRSELLSAGISVDDLAERTVSSARLNSNFEMLKQVFDREYSRETSKLNETESPQQ